MNEKITKDTLSKIRKNELCLTFNSWYHDTYGSRVNKSKELYACMDRVYGTCRNNYWYGVKIVYERDENQECDMSIRTDVEEEDERV
jgi:hypothetical protein